MIEEKIDLSKLTPQQIKEREEFFKQYPDEGPRQYFVTCSGTVSPLPSTNEEWESARENGLINVDGAEIIPEDD